MRDRYPSVQVIESGRNAGFGAASIIHTEKLLEMSTDLPVLIEVVDERARIEAVLPRLEELIGGCGGLITMENVRVIRYVEGEREER